MNNYKKHKKYERGDVIGEQGQLCAECNFRQYIGEVSGVGGGGLCGTVTLHWYLIQRKSKWYGSCAFWSFFGLCTTVDLTTKCTIMYLSSCILVLFGAISDYKEPLSWRKNTKSTKSTKSTRFGHPTTVCDTMLSTTIKHDKHQKHERRTSD